MAKYDAATAYGVPMERGRPERRKYVAAAALLLLLLMGCASEKTPAAGGGTPSDGTVSLAADAGRYAPGDKPTLTLRNGTEGQVGYNLCFAFVHLERREANEWKSVTANLGPGGNVACTSELRLLQQGASATGEVHLPGDLPPGTYRLTHRVEIESADQTIATDAFEVTA